MVNLDDISNNLQSGKARETSALITKAIAENFTIDTIVKQGLIAGIQAAEARYGRNEVLVPEIRMARRAMEWGIRQIKQAIAAAGRTALGTVVIGSVEGDIEDQDKNIIAVMMESRNLRVVDLGTSVSPARFVEVAEEEQAHIIVCLASLVTTMAQMKIVVQEALSAGIRKRVKIILTGAPVTERYCRIIGADMYAHDIVIAADLAEAYCESIRNCT
ncbi:MAG: cobalamin-dependent protein [Treponema sp.]|jgi:methanogenic corrinoid protein MtbC1|nr:cobalamin-dependent protein [Treponema sp.]